MRPPKHTDMSRARPHHGCELGVVGLSNTQDVGGVHYFHREAGQPAGDARSCPERGQYLQFVADKVSNVSLDPSDWPSKWKKWFCWLLCGLASAAAPTGPMFSSTPAPCCGLLSWPPSPLMFRDVRHVGQEVSCSSQDRRHELETQRVAVLSAV